MLTIITHNAEFFYEYKQKLIKDNDNTYVIG